MYTIILVQLSGLKQIKDDIVQNSRASKVRVHLKDTFFSHINSAGGPDSQVV